MRQLAAQPLFTVADHSYSYGDAVLWGLYAGPWRDLEARVRAGLAATGEVPDAELSAAIIAWRRERRLLAAADLRSWLGERELTAADLTAVHARAWRRAHGSAGDPSCVADADIAAALHAEALVDGTLAQCAHALAERAAAAHAARTDAPSVPGESASALLAEAVAGPDRGIAGRELYASLHRVLDAERAYTAFVAAAATPERLERRLRARRLDLTQLRYEIVALPHASAAREAIACVCVDGLALGQIAARAGAACAARTSTVIELDDALRAALAAGRPGELVGPIAGGDGFAVAVVRDRRAPRLEDPAVRAVLTSEVVAAQLERQAAGRVEWHGHL